MNVKSTSTQSSALHVLLYLALNTFAARGWSFSVELQTSQCTGVTVDWEGGSPPYYFTFLHTATVSSSNISNPSAWTSGGGLTWDLAHNSTVFLDDGYRTPLVIVGSDATGFGSGGTSQVSTSLPEGSTDCLNIPSGQSNNVSYLQSMSTEMTACGTVIAQLNPSSSPQVDWVDTIVPLGSSYRTYTNMSTTNGTTLAWPMNVNAGVNVSFAFHAGDLGYVMVTPFFEVQPGNTSCQASGTSSSAPTVSTSTSNAQVMKTGWEGGAGLSTMLAAMAAVCFAVVSGMVRL